MSRHLRGVSSRKWELKMAGDTKSLKMSSWKEEVVKLIAAKRRMIMRQRLQNQ